VPYIVNLSYDLTLESSLGYEGVFRREYLLIGPPRTAPFVPARPLRSNLDGSCPQNQVQAVTDPEPRPAPHSHPHPRRTLERDSTSEVRPGQTLRLTASRTGAFVAVDNQQHLIDWDTTPPSSPLSNRSSRYPGRSDSKYTERDPPPSPEHPPTPPPDRGASGIEKPR
jgi:hypothetical protein